MIMTVDNCNERDRATNSIPFDVMLDFWIIMNYNKCSNGWAKKLQKEKGDIEYAALVPSFAFGVAMNGHSKNSLLLDYIYITQIIDYRLLLFCIIEITTRVITRITR